MKVALAGLVVLSALVVLLPVVVFAAVVGAIATPAAAPAALPGVPPGALAAYEQAATMCSGLSWTVLAGIGEVESDHGRADLPGVRSGANSAGAEVICRWARCFWHVRDGCRRSRGCGVSATCQGRVSSRTSVRVMVPVYRAERAVSPSDGTVSWVVVDNDFDLHAEGCAFLAGLRGRDRSPNTERVYAGRVALFLSWCADEGVAWGQVRLDQMARFKSRLVAEPISASRLEPGRQRFRSPATADAVLGTACEFLRFCAVHGLADATAVGRLFESRYLRFLPPGREAGEDGRFRTVRSRVLKFAVAETPFEFVEADRVDDLVAAAGNPRDRFLVALVAMTGMRIGETLGLHREDMHLLADSRSLGCWVAGPHLHVRRRTANPNGALAKSRFPRSIPVPAEAITSYADYAYERHARLGDDDSSPLVFVNLYRAPLGGGLRYQNVKAMFDRLARQTGVGVRPHLLRHTAATTWLRQGTPPDTVQHLLGHVSPVSMQPYVHPNEADKRAAVEQGSKWTKGPRP